MYHNKDYHQVLEQMFQEWNNYLKKQDFLATHKIKTFEELSNYQDDVNFKIKEILDQRERLWAKKKVIKRWK